MSELRPAWVEIDLDALAHNVRQIRRLIGPACKLFSVVKGDGYGIGVVAAFTFMFVQSYIEQRPKGWASPQALKARTRPDSRGE